MFSQQSQLNASNQLDESLSVTPTIASAFDSSINLLHHNPNSSFLTELAEKLETITTSDYLDIPTPDEFGVFNKLTSNYNFPVDYNSSELISGTTNENINTPIFLTDETHSLESSYFNADTLPSEETGDTLTASNTAQSTKFSNVHGYGVVDAAHAVAKAIGQQRFAEVPDYSNEYDWGLDAISVPEVWSQGYAGQDVVVAVIDSGVDYTHSDLNDNIWFNTDEVYGDGIDNDKNGYVDDVIGWDFVSGDNNVMDEQIHGTHVAGIIAAEADGYGMTGVAYSSKIMPVRVLDKDGVGNTQNIARGIVYAADNGANVINLSLGGDYSADIESAIKYATQKGTFVVMAAGNRGLDECQNPAASAADWGIAVGAIDSNWYMADFSDRAGSDSHIHYVVAPGVDIYSTTPGDNYEFLDGTSMAAPYVSGVAALMLSANPYLTPQQIREIIVSTAIG